MWYDDGLLTLPRLLLPWQVVGSGKSTFAQALETQLPECFVRCNQDALGSRRAVETAVRRALASGKSPVIDRVNGDAGQRATWVDLAAATTGAAAAAAAVEVWALEFATPMATCRARLVERTGHETLRSTEQALDVLARFSRGYAPPRASEGFHRIAQVRPADMPCVPPSAADIEAILARLAAAPALVPTTQVSYPSPSRRPAHSHRGGAQRPWRPARPTGRGPGYAYGRGGGGGYLPQLVRAYESPYAPGHSGYSGQPQGLSPLHSSSIGPPPYGAHRPAAAAAAHPHPPFYGHDSNDSSSGRPPRSNAHPENSQDGRW